MKLVYGLLALMIVSIATQSQAREGLFSRWRNRQTTNGCTGGYVNTVQSYGSNGGYVSSTKSYGSTGSLQAPTYAPSYGSTGSAVTSNGSTGGYVVEIVPTPIPMAVVPMDAPIYETSTQEKPARRVRDLFPIFPQLWETKAACPNGVCPN